MPIQAPKVPRWLEQHAQMGALWAYYWDLRNVKPGQMDPETAHATMVRKAISAAGRCIEDRMQCVYKIREVIAGEMDKKYLRVPDMDRFATGCLWSVYWNMRTEAPREIYGGCGTTMSHAALRDFERPEDTAYRKLIEPVELTIKAYEEEIKRLTKNL